MKPVRRLLLLALLASAAACSNAPGGSDSAYERGVAALRKGEPRTARVELLNAIKERPNDPKVRLVQAETLIALGDGAAAQAEIDRARKLGATEADTAHLMSHALFLQGAHAQAAEEGARAAEPHLSYGLWVRGLALSALGDAGGADAALRQAVAAGPKDHRAWLALARFRRDHGEIGGAIEASGRAIALKPDDVEALTFRGELTRVQYGLVAAMPWFDRAIEVDENNVVALLERAATLGELGEANEMLADTRKVLSLSPSNPRAFYLQATLAARAGNFPLAKSLLHRTGGKLGDQPATMLLASAIDFETGAVQQAATRLEKLLAKQPGNRKARRLLAAAYWRLGDPAATVRAIRPIADAPDADLYSLRLIGKALRKQGQADRAAPYLARALRPGLRPGTLGPPVTDERLGQLRYAARTRPADVQAQIQLIGALVSNGLADEALERARALQAAYPGAPDAHVMVGDALGLRGDFAGAADEYHRAANLAFTEPTALRLVEALQRAGRGAAAAKVLELFLQQNPRSVPALLLAGNAYLGARNWPAAIEALESLRERLGDRDAAMLSNLAFAYSQQGDLESAVPLARKAWSLDKSNPATADLLGWLLVRSGKKPEGLALLELAARTARKEAAMPAPVPAPAPAVAPVTAAPAPAPAP